MGGIWIEREENERVASAQVKSLLRRRKVADALMEGAVLEDIPKENLITSPLAVSWFLRCTQSGTATATATATVTSTVTVAAAATTTTACHHRYRTPRAPTATPTSTIHRFLQRNCFGNASFNLRAW
jgi:uncharacterized protein YerC